LRLLENENPYARLDALGRQIATALRDAAKTKGLPLQVPQVGSMFALFFTDEAVRDYTTALRSDARIFARFFHLCLEQGVYLPPSAYETCFLSTAHDGPALVRAGEIMTKALRSL
jgi:glutamate-1-semialdehyde 2,1-aminomutase